MHSSEGAQDIQDTHQAHAQDIQGTAQDIQDTAQGIQDTAQGIQGAAQGIQDAGPRPGRRGHPFSSRSGCVI